MQHKIAHLEWSFRVLMKNWKQKFFCQEVHFSILTYSLEPCTGSLKCLGHSNISAHLPKLEPHQINYIIAHNIMCYFIAFKIEAD